MDYLDPAKKRAHRNRIVIGYGLFAVLIAFATMVLVFVANGYFIDSRGEVIQNGIVFVDSKPRGAELYLNGEKQNRATDTRLVVPGGENYDVELRKDGYRNWSRNIQLDGGSLRQLTYALLIPEQFEQGLTTNLRSNRVDSIQSPNKESVVISYQNNPLSLQVFDTTSEIPSVAPLALDAALVSDPENAGLLEFVEWADDNKMLLAKYTNVELVEYLLIDTENPERSSNLTRLLSNGQPYSFSFRDGKSDEFYAFHTNQRLLYRANTTLIGQNPVLETPLLSFDTHRADWIVYAAENTLSNQVEIRFARTQDDVDILIRDNLMMSNEYLVEVHSLNNAPVLAFSSPSENRAIAYADPEAFLRANPEARLPLATTVLRATEPSQLLFSSTGRTLLVAGSTFASHEFRADRTHTYEITAERNKQYDVAWVDDSHFTFTDVSNIQHVVDFDGSNQYDLLTSLPGVSYFDKDLQTIFTMENSRQTNPETTIPARIVSTSLIVEEQN